MKDEPGGEPGGEPSVEPADELDGLRARQLIEWLATSAASLCRSCRAALCAHELLFASALGHKRQPACSACLARELDSSAAGLRSHLRAHFERRHCFRAAWRHADERELDCALRAVRPATGPADAALAIEVPPDEEWDAGDLACGELVLELRLKMRALPPGATLELCATDPGAPEDLPAWCRLTGHELVLARAPRYRIRRPRA